jgi:plastocyanin
MKKRINLLALALLTAIALFYSCGKSSSYNNPTSDGSHTPVAAASVSIENFKFSPAVVYLKPGGTVTWTNKDASPHTATDIGGSFDSGTLDVDKTFKFTFATAGTYTYHCTIHSMMPNATIVVGN